MTDFRLTLDVDEETRARWQAAAGRIGYERLEVWARDTLDAAADPDAGQVLDLRARLTTAEARVKALSEALRQIAENNRVAVPTSDPRPEVIDGEPATVTYVRYERPDAVAIARAALACPPQQPQKAGE